MSTPPKPRSRAAEAAYARVAETIRKVKAGDTACVNRVTKAEVWQEDEQTTIRVQCDTAGDAWSRFVVDIDSEIIWVDLRSDKRPDA